MPRPGNLRMVDALQQAWPQNISQDLQVEAGPKSNVMIRCRNRDSKSIWLGQGLVAGQTEAAVAGGVNIMLEPRTTARICLLQALSPVGAAARHLMPAETGMAGEKALPLLFSGESVVHV